MLTMRQLLHLMVERGASDLHITVGSPPQLRIDNKLVPLDLEVLTPEMTQQLAYSILTDWQKEKFEREDELDLSFGIKNLSRFRVNIFKQRACIACAVRRIPFRIPSLEELGLPSVVRTFTSKTRGLILVTGPTGSGKSTTLAAMVECINKERHAHIITIEDPIEYLHQHRNSLVNQREVNSDTKNFATALKYVLRQDPDVILIGEMRDLDTINAAIVISETGHLVLATLHTPDTVQTINRIIDVFPPHQQPQVRTQLSFILEGVIAQQLLPKFNAKGRVLATEILVVTPGIRNLIREDKIHQIYSAIQTGQKFGMQTMNQSLASLYLRRLVSYEDAVARSSHPVELREIINKEAVAL